MEKALVLLDKFSQKQMESAKHLNDLMKDLKHDLCMKSKFTDKKTTIAFYKFIRDTWLSENDMSMDDKETIMWNNLMLKVSVA